MKIYLSNRDRHEYDQDNQQELGNFPVCSSDDNHISFDFKFTTISTFYLYFCIITNKVLAVSNPSQIDKFTPTFKLFITKTKDLNHLSFSLWCSLYNFFRNKVLKFLTFNTITCQSWKFILSQSTFENKINISSSNSSKEQNWTPYSLF